MAPKTILVTGGNRGIGNAIVQSLAMHPTLQDSTVLMGCRDLSKAESAIQSLKEHGISNVQPVQIEVSSDESIRTAAQHISLTYKGLDILINNAGYASIPKEADLSDLRQAFQDTYNINVTSVAMVTAVFLPLLRLSRWGGKVIQVSSARGSISRSVAGELPPTVAMNYSISKTALNALTIELSRLEINKDVEFQMASPGHCRTQFNGFKGTRDPTQGAIVVVELATSPRRKTANYETYGESTELMEIPW